MTENDNGRKKALIISVLIFLFFGGGIFLFFIIQGAEDLKDNKMKNFSYGSEARAGVSAFMKYLGFTSDEAELSKAARGRLAARGLDSSASGPAADISDWMNKDGAGTDSSGGLSASGAQASGASVPRMAAKGSGLGSAGGAGTKSSAELARFGSGGDSNNVTVSKAGALGARGQDAKNATLSSLRNSQAYLGDALRSSSAMEAKSKWGQSFGVGLAGSGGTLGYSKPGMVKLDAIKSGEISSLKTNDPKSLKVADVSAPEKDKDAEAKDPALNKMKDAAKDASNPASGLANSMFSPVANSMRPSSAGNGDNPASAPPKEITDIGNLPKPEGSYCPKAEGCSTDPPGATFRDNAPTYQKAKEGWQVTYTGQQTGEDGKVTFYKDVCNIMPGGTPPVTPATVYEGASSDNIKQIWSAPQPAP